ncbi:MAG: hypothetical protein ACI9VR_001051 [Cognaticolwellia sp.]|jgi:hypothetical protein
MRITTTLLLLGLCACSPELQTLTTAKATAAEPEDCPESSDLGCVTGPNSGAFSQDDLKAATAFAQSHLLTIQELDAEQRQQAGTSLELLTANSLFTRSAVQLPVVLHQAVMQVDSQDVAPEMQEDWRLLQAGLSAHVETLDALGVKLGAPKSGQHLHGLALAKTREQVLFGADPMGDTLNLVAAIPPTLPQPYLDIERFHTHQVDRLTGQPWTLNNHTRAWHSALRRVEPAMSNPQDKASVNAMIRLLDAYFGQGC